MREPVGDGAVEPVESDRYEALAAYVERLRHAADQAVERWEVGDLAGAVHELEQVACEVVGADEAAAFGRCGVCGAAITEAENRALGADVDFIEHRGHVIWRRPRWRSEVTVREGGQA